MYVYDNVYDIVNEYNHTYHRTIIVKPVNVKDNTDLDSCKEINGDQYPKFLVDDHVRIAKYINIFARIYSKLFWKNFEIKKVKKTVPWTVPYLINDLNGEELLETCHEKEFKKKQIKNNLG